jgi:hypothetical protein
MKEADLPDDTEPEPVLLACFAGRLTAGINMMGGSLFLMPGAVVFIPLISRSGLKTSNLAAGISKHLHDWDLSPQKLLNTAIMPLTKPIVIPLNQVQAVTPTRRCALLFRWLEPPRQRTAEFGIAATRFSSIWNRANIKSRDEFLLAIEAALPGATGR